MSKDFKIARRPGQAGESTGGPTARGVTSGRSGAKKAETIANAAKPSALANADTQPGLATRKTIEVPEGYFFQVKLRAVERHLKEKELWAEILKEYFERHPVP